MYCFTNFSFLQNIVIRKNSLDIVERLSCYNLSKLRLIDLSQNYLQTLPESTFMQAQMYILDISQNCLLDVDIKAFGGVLVSEIVTSFPPLCCAKSFETKCTIFLVKGNVLLSCSNLLPSLVLKIFFPFVSVSLIMLNKVSLFVHILDVIRNLKSNNVDRGKKSSGVYEVIVSLLMYQSSLLGHTSLSSGQLTHIFKKSLWSNNFCGRGVSYVCWFV